MRAFLEGRAAKVQQGLRPQPKRRPGSRRRPTPATARYRSCDLRRRRRDCASRGRRRHLRACRRAAWRLSGAHHRPPAALGRDARRERTLHGARSAADGGDWRHVSYAEALQGARRIAQALLDRGLSAERPVRSCPRTTSSTRCWRSAAMLRRRARTRRSRRPIRCVSQDYGKLRHILDTLTPGPGVRRRRRALRQGDRARRCRPTPGGAGAQARARRPRDAHAVRRPARDARRPPAVDARACARSARTRSPSSCSPRARPSCPRRVINTQRMCAPTSR